MEAEKEKELKSKVIQQIVGNVSFAEIVKIVHALASKETEYQFSQYTEQEKDEIYEELFQSEMPKLSTDEVD